MASSFRFIAGLDVIKLRPPDLKIFKASPPSPKISQLSLSLSLALSPSLHSIIIAQIRYTKDYNNRGESGSDD